VLHRPDDDVLANAASGPGCSAVEQLGHTLHLHRLARGWSLRQMAGRVGLSAHSALVDYEHGRRVLPEDLTRACERALELPPDLLGALRRRALAELAARKLGLPEPGLPEPGLPEPGLPEPGLPEPGLPRPGHGGGRPAAAPPATRPCPGCAAAITARLREIAGIACVAQARVLLAVARRIWGEVDSAVPPRR
jgi:transcriptional regulator with XRE-family HTH domain